MKHLSPGGSIRRHYSNQITWGAAGWESTCWYLGPGAERTARIPHRSSTKVPSPLTSVLRMGEHKWKLWKTPTFHPSCSGHSVLTWETCPSLDLTQLENFPHHPHTVSSGESQAERGETRLIILFQYSPSVCSLIKWPSSFLEWSLEDQTILIYRTL